MWESLESILDQVGLATLVDIGLTAVVIYWVFSLIRGTRAVRLVIGVSGIHSDGTILPLTGQPMRSVCQMLRSADCGALAKISSMKKRTSRERCTRPQTSASGESNTSRRNAGTVRAM
jgi:hypothetical protein